MSAPRPQTLCAPEPPLSEGVEPTTPKHAWAGSSSFCSSLSLSAGVEPISPNHPSGCSPFSSSFSSTASTVRTFSLRPRPATPAPEEDGEWRSSLRSDQDGGVLLLSTAHTHKSASSALEGRDVREQEEQRSCVANQQFMPECIEAVLDYLEAGPLRMPSTSSAAGNFDFMFDIEDEEGAAAE
jgi:hypothetical protein